MLIPLCIVSFIIQIGREKFAAQYGTSCHVMSHVGMVANN